MISITTRRTSTVGIVAMGLALALALGLMTLMPATVEATPSGMGTIWLTDRNAAGTVTAYDAATGELLGLAWVGQNPIGVAGSPQTNRVYVTNEGSGSNSISVIDADTVTVLATIPTGPRPHHVQVSPNGRYLYFAEFNTNKVGVLDTTTLALREYETAPGNTTARTHSVWPTADGKYLYAANSDVTNTASNGFVVKLDAASGTILWTLNVGIQPSEVTVAPNGKIGYVTVRGENTVKVLDLAAPAIIGSVAVGTQPDTALLTPDGKLLTVSLRGNPAQMTIRRHRNAEREDREPHRRVSRSSRRLAGRALHVCGGRGWSGPAAGHRDRRQHAGRADWLHRSPPARRQAARSLAGASNALGQTLLLAEAVRTGGLNPPVAGPHNHA